LAGTSRKDKIPYFHLQKNIYIKSHFGLFETQYFNIPYKWQKTDDPNKCLNAYHLVGKMGIPRSG
jgi:hypothetical protein